MRPSKYQPSIVMQPVVGQHTHMTAWWQAMRSTCSTFATTPLTSWTDVEGGSPDENSEEADVHSSSQRRLRGVRAFVSGASIMPPRRAVAPLPFERHNASGEASFAISGDPPAIASDDIQR